MQFASPIWIVIGLVVCTGLSLLLYRLEKQKRHKLEIFAGSRLAGRLTRNTSPTLRRIKALLLLSALLMIFVSLARPQYGFRWVEVKRKGIDILFALDTSRSMMAQDLKPNRLERARLGILDFISGLEGDRIGLMPFAGASFLMTPLTLDYTAFETSLVSIDTTVIPFGGTNITGLIQEAESVLNNDANHKILILLTDGENLEGDAVEAAKKAKENGLTIHTVGIGTPDGELIPLPESEGSGFVKDKEGHYVTSRLDEDVLKEVAEATGGIYTPLGNSGEGLEKIYQERLTLIPKEELAERKHRVPLERFGYPLAAALILLVLEWLVPERKTSPARALSSITSKSRRLRKLFAILLCFSCLSVSTRVTRASEGEIAYLEGNYIGASELYTEMLEKDPGNPELHYNFGTSAYKNNMFDDAIASFSQALKGNDLELQARAYYNRGNAYYKKGESAMQANPKETSELWEQAISSYQGALELNNGDMQAKENLQFVRQKLEELQQQMQNQQNNQQKNEQDQNRDQEQDQNTENRQKGDNQDQQESQGQKPPEENDPPPGENGNETGQENSREQEDQGQQQENTDEQNPDQGTQSAQPQDNNDDSPTAAASQQAEEAKETDKMSKEEAENLLNLMKNNEGELNFVPRFERHQNSGRDW